MSRPSKAELDRLGVEIAVERLVEERGIVLTAGAGRCPWCSTPDGLVVDRTANRWSCTSCGVGGGPVEWVMRTEGVSLAHAVEVLREGMPVTGSGRPVKATTRRLLPTFTAGLPDVELLSDVVGFYHRTFNESPEAGEFLQRRGLANAEMVEAFTVGFSNRGLGLRIPDRNRTDGKSIRGQLQSIGVIGAKGHEAFRGSVVIPITDVDARVVQLYGRKVTAKLHAGTELHTWLARPRPLFNAATLTTNSEVILAGSVLDALSLWCAGFRHVVAVDTPAGFDQSHLQTLTAHGVGRVVIGFPRTDAGHTAADTTSRRLLAAGIECFGIELPRGLDLNDYARRCANPTDAFGKAIRAASWMGKGPAPSKRSVSVNPLTDDTTNAPIEAAPAPVVGGPAVEDLDDNDDVGFEVADDLAGFEDLADLDDDEGEGEGDRPVIEVDDGPGALLASPVPPVPADTEAVFDGEALRVTFGDRHWRIRNLERNTSFDVLRVNVCVSVPASPRGPGFHVDVFDLYSARARAVFIRDAATEICVDAKIIKADLAKVFGAVEAFVEDAIRRAQQPEDPKVVLDADERAAAMELLTDRHLIERIVADFERAGMVGEATNCLIGYLATVSRLLERPLAVMVQSTSAAGKSALMDAVLDFVPAEDRVAFSAMTGQSLYYMGERDLAHKVLAIAEEEGAERASYALKLLQSEGQLSIASTGKDTSTGRLTTHPYHVEGPAAILLTTTAIDVDEELLNRCVVLTVNEDQDQTKAIHHRQRRSRTLQGILAGSDRTAVLKVHQDAQRLLEAVTVVNPFADRLGFADSATRTRRDHVKYLTLIETITLVHQHQRRRRNAVTGDGATVTYIEATLDDIALANRLAHEALGRSLDELPPQTRRLLDAVDQMVAAIAAERSIDRDKVRFTRRDTRERLGWGDTQLKVHLARLVDLELVWVHRTDRAGAFVYELAWDNTAADQRRFLPGLVDVGALRNNPPHPNSIAAAANKNDVSGGDAVADAVMTPDRSGPEPARSGAGRGPVGPRSGGGHTPANGNGAQVNGHKPGGNGAGGAVGTVRGPRPRGGRTATTTVEPSPAGAGNGVNRDGAGR